MRKGYLFLLLVLASKGLFAQTEIGPEGHNLFWVFLFILVPLFLYAIYRLTKKNKNQPKKKFISIRRLHIILKKDKLYYPDVLNLNIENKGNTDIDLAQPMLVLSNYWVKRKFKLKGSQNKVFYPLYLESGKNHELEINLNQFYKHDKSLKKFPKATIKIADVKGKSYGSKSVFLRKTLVKF